MEGDENEVAREEYYTVYILPEAERCITPNPLVYEATA